MIRQTVLLAVSLVVATLFHIPELSAEESFRSWVEDFRREAEASGISRDVYLHAFQGIDQPDKVALERAAYQPEFTMEIWDYLDTRVNSLSISRGQKMREQYGDILQQIEEDSGVPAPVILAIWSMETNYGLVLKNKKRLHYVPKALATLGWGDPKRGKFGRTQLVAALKILQAGDVDRENLLGSWAGAMGHTQFIPTSYLAYGVDFDGDGKRDIWNSVPDALATAANLLAKNGWRAGKTWGYEVVVPTTLAKYEGETMTLVEWQKLGIVRPGGKGFPRLSDRAELKMIGGADGPGFLMLKNFFVIKRYNNSDFYALAVGLLADRLGGWGQMVQPWPRPQGSLSFEEKLEVQRLLKAQGYYQGEIDGHLGKGSRQGIRAYQQQAGQSVDGRPTRQLLDELRRL